MVYETTLAILSGVVGALLVVLTARKVWFEGSGEKQQTATERDQAEAAAADRIIELLKEQYEIALEKERLQYEVRLKEEVERLREEMNRRFNELLDIYGCQNASEGCENRVIPHRPLRGF